MFTVSRRSEPSSRAALIGEQPNPWDLIVFSHVAMGIRLYHHRILICHQTKILGASRVIGA